MRRFILSSTAARGPFLGGSRPSAAGPAALALVSLALGCLAACGGGGGKGMITPPVDGGMDAADAHRMGVTCTAVVPWQPRGLGAGCVANADCTS